jgi:ubiquinone/menaquinone biosynthesis C-methylase UbiE
MAYIYDQAADPTERERLALLQRYYDPKTIAKLICIGVAPGWNCLDVGAGAGSVAQWLAGRVGVNGSVLAIDLDTALLEPLASRTLSVRRQDIRREELPKSLDLVHARLVLEHIPEYEDALQRMVDALCPGGWLLLTDVDFRSIRLSEPDPAFDRVASAFVESTQAVGCNTQLGPELPSMCEKAGLTDVAAESWQTYARGGIAGQILARSYRRLRDRLISYGATPADIDRVTTRIERAAVGVFGPTSWMAWGRRA